MKKVLCLMLSIVMLFALASCSQTSNNEPNLFDIIDQGRVPVTITTTVSYNLLDENNADNNISLSGFYKTVTEWNRSIFTFTYERFALVEENNDEIMKEVSGTIYKDGDKVSVDGDNFEDSKALPGYGITINLSEDCFDSYTISEDGKSFTAKVTGENIKKALGVDLATDANGATLYVASNGIVITGLTVSYKTALGADVFIATSYTYNPASFDWPADK